MQKKKAGEWYIRLENEFRNNKERCRFITLTFNEESLNKYIELARKEIKEKKKYSIFKPPWRLNGDGAIEGA